MARITIGLGIVLILLGVVSYVATGMQSWTALIPSIFGVLMSGFGFAARYDRFRRHAIHSAVLLSVFGFGGTVSGLKKMPLVIRGEDVERPAAVVVQAVMAVLCLGYFLLGLWSFINARRGGPLKQQD